MTRVLVVEDDPIVARLTRSLLGRLGFESDWVETGRHAIELLSERRYPLVLLDMGLPDVDGVGVMVWLRHFEKERHRERTCVFVLSASDVRPSRALDVDGVLQKPLRMPALEEAVQRSVGVAP